MRLLKKILIVLGSLFLAVIVLIVWLGVQSVRFKRAETPFVKAYVTDLSRRWNVADVYDRSANEFLAQAESPEGRRAIQTFKLLGALTSIHDFELKNFSDGTLGRRGVFDFKGGFENGKALVEVTVLDTGQGGAQVLSIHLTSIQVKPSAGGKVST